MTMPFATTTTISSTNDIITIEIPTPISNYSSVDFVRARRRFDASLARLREEMRAAREVEPENPAAPSRDRTTIHATASAGTRLIAEGRTRHPRPSEAPAAA